MILVSPGTEHDANVKLATKLSAHQNMLINASTRSSKELKTHELVSQLRNMPQKERVLEELQVSQLCETVELQL